MASDMELEFYSDGKNTELHFIHGYGSFAVTVEEKTAKAIKALWLKGAKMFLSSDEPFMLTSEEKEPKYFVYRYAGLANLYFQLEVNGVQFDFQLSEEEAKKFKQWYLDE